MRRVKSKSVLSMSFTTNASNKSLLQKAEGLTGHSKPIPVILERYKLHI